MKVCTYMEWDSARHSGIGTSVENQRKALESVGVTVTDDPSDDYDVLNVNTVGPRGLYHLWRARSDGKPGIVHAHTTGEDFRNSFRGSNLAAPAVKELVKRYYNRADAVIAPSDHTRRTLEQYPVTPPIHVVSNGVDTQRLTGYDEYGAGFRNEHGLDGLVVFSLGHAFERKGVSTFCEVAKQLPDLEFVWFGAVMDNPLGSSSVRRWIDDPPENVTFTGFIDDVRTAFGVGDLFFFPATEENQGIVALEAMATGKPIVVSDHPVFTEYLTDGETCLTGSNVREYTRALERLRDDPALRKTLSDNASEAVQAHTLDRVGTALTDVYETVIAHNGSPGQ